ncbi:Ficolin-1 [Stylophora pistillata]|uniref:Ficolin-1 n=1 Tax=Stylophora pistillata TaxID=50429 RepID=A0A2B4RAX9_STYPI|nr:Ficolin-1 [Stylophora pistillata]
MEGVKVQFLLNLSFLLISFTNGDIRMITPNFKAVNFAREIRGRRLNGSVIREIEVDSEGSCRLQCVEEESCMSYNFGPSKNKKRFKCQLSDSDRFVGLKNFTEDDEYLYRGVKRRLDGSVDFYLGWESYKRGFGNLSGEFWLGNDNLHRLTAVDDVILRVDLEDFDGNVTYAAYTTFKVANEADKYQLLIEGYKGTAGDSMTFQRDMNFTTKDEDNDVHDQWNCAIEYKGAWWYKGCHSSNLNGLYHNGPHNSFADGVNWFDFRGYRYSLKRTEMKIKARI